MIRAILDLYRIHREAKREKKFKELQEATQRLVEDVADYYSLVYSGAGSIHNVVGNRLDMYASFNEWMMAVRNYYGMFRYQTEVSILIIDIAERAGKKSGIEIDVCEFQEFLQESLEYS